MNEYPIKVRWSNDSASLNKFLTRQIEPAKGTPNDRQDFVPEVPRLAAATVTRQKTNVVIETEEERDALLLMLRQFGGGIAHPASGGKWATKSQHDAIKRVISDIESAE